MTQEQQDFVELCAQLRLLGANEVRCGDRHVKFEGRLRPAAQPATEETAREEPVLTPEQAIEARYARELGRATPAAK